MSTDPSPTGEVAGAQLAEARRTAGLTQKALANRLGLSVWMLDSFEMGRRDLHLPSSDIAAVVGVPAAALAPAGPGSALPIALPQTSRGTSRAAAEALRATSSRDLVLASLAVLVIIRFFTEVVHVLPRALNFVDIPIALTLGVAALAKPLSTMKSRYYMATAAFVIAFLFVSVFSVGLNLSRVAPGPVLVFLYGFLAPIAVYASVYRLWPSGQAGVMSRFLVALGVIQLAVVALVDLPRFIPGSNPDVISGTFGTNPYQLVFFLLVLAALLAGILTLEPGTFAARAAPAMLLLILATTFLAQYRALLAASVLTMLVVAGLLSGRARGLLSVAVIAVCFGVTLSYVASHFPGLKFSSTVSTLSAHPTYYVSRRLHAAGNVMSMFNDNPQALAYGTGPGTFSSRAWQTFARAGSSSRSNVQGSYVKFLGGEGASSTDVSDKYVLPQYQNAQVVQGSGALSSPFFSYVSLMAEVGLPGFFLITALYVLGAVRAVRMARSSMRDPTPGDSLPALLIASAAAFTLLLQMAFLENWLEVTRVTFIAWTLLAVGSKELSSRTEEQR
jgi:hypothetical protein